MSEVDALLPVLVAELEDGARALIVEAASTRKTILVPLVDAPVDASLHVLEVTTPSESMPLVVLAEPAGAPTEQGFPLTLHPIDSPPTAPSLVPQPGEPLPSVRARRARPITLTKHHTRDLLGDAAPPSSSLGSNPAALVGREIGGKLVVENLVGIGGMGAVYACRHKQLGIRVALKVLHERFRSDLAFCARFHAEALAVSQLDHVNLVRVSDFGQESDGLLYLAMDFLEGEELGERLDREGTLTLPRIAAIGMQVSAGLGHAHMRGIVHRDVKPSNIILVKGEDDEGHPIDVPKVCDFGIAGRTGARDLVGTPAYMSPEQCEGGDVDGRSDIYALGIILYELATGQLPFSSDDATTVIQMQLEKEPLAPSFVRPVDARLEALILAMLKKSPEHRPQTMKDVRAALRTLSRPPSLDLFDVGASRNERGQPPKSSPNQKDAPTKTEAASKEAHAAAVAAAEEAAVPRPTYSTQMDAVVLPPNVPEIAARLAKEPVSTLRETLSSPERFAKEAQGLAAAMMQMLEQRELAALAQVLGLLESAANDPAGGAVPELASHVVRAMHDPTKLARAAERVLSEHDEEGQALLAHLGLAAAHALYNARIRANPTPHVRGRFGATLRAIGHAAFPLVATALSRNAPGDNAQHDAKLAEDLLRAMPLRADEATGGVVAKYLRWGDAAERRAAIPPLVALWGERARPLLLADLMKDVDEGARVAAMRGLRDLGAIDDAVVRKCEEILAKATDGAALCVVAAEALGEATAEAKPIAEAALRRLLVPHAKPGGMFGRLRGKAGRAQSVPPLVLIAMARSFAALGPADAKKTIEDIAKQTEDPLKTQLLGARG